MQVMADPPAAGRDGVRHAGKNPSPTKSKRRRSGSNEVVAPSNRWCPTVMTVPSGASKASSVKLVAAKQDRMAGVASGGRRCLVQMTCAPGRQNEGSVSMVAVMSPALMLPKTPHTRTRSAGTCSAYHREQGGVTLDDTHHVTDPGPVGARPGEGHERMVQLHEQRDDVVPPMVLGDDVDDVTTLTGTQADDTDRAGRDGVERLAHHRLDRAQTERQVRRRILVGGVPLLPMGRLVVAGDARRGQVLLGPRTPWRSIVGWVPVTAP